MVLLLTVSQVTHPTEAAWRYNPVQHSQFPDCAAAPPCNNALQFSPQLKLTVLDDSYSFASILPGQLDIITDEVLNTLQFRGQIPTDKRLHTCNFVVTWHIPLQLHVVWVPWLAPVLQP